ncbi:MAG: ATP-binding cassette domain-containing protein [Planctomycetes bacterium]|nr:ATP-binding cassette domain-containing protein [Planctomycetota bacterium]
MALITLSDVAKAYDEKRPLFKDVSLVVGSEDRIGLIGPNGAGKSTLLRMLAGIEVADEGTRVMRRGLRVGFLEQEPQLPHDMSIHDAVRAGLGGREGLLKELDELYVELADPELTEKRLDTLSTRQADLQHKLDEMGGHDIDYQIDAAIDGVGLPDPHVLCGQLSGGEARRVALARLLVDQPDVMLLDEPTNHLDAFVVAWLEKRLASLRVPLVLVTHDRFLLDRVANRIVEIDRGRTFEYEGNYVKYVEQRAERMAGEAKSEHSRLRLLKRETAWMRAGVLARATKAKARIDRFHELSDAPALVLPSELEMKIPPGPRLGTKVVNVTDVSFSYGDQSIIEGLEVELQPGMRLGVVGPNGAGKTTLLKLLLGQLDPDAGEIVIGETVKFGSIEQKREDLDPEATVAEEVAGKSETVLVGDRKLHVVSFLDSFLFPGNKKFVKVGSLSGGERGRVLLAKLLLQDCNVLILDEPTNDLDLATLRALEEALCAFPGVSITVSHDRWFLDRVATHILYLDGSGKVFLHTGNISSLLERAAKLESESGKATAETLNMAPKAATSESKRPVIAKSSTAAAPAKTKARKLTFKEKNEFEELEVRIAESEEHLATLDAELVAPETYQGDSEIARKLQTERDALATALDADMERWAELGEFA